MISVLLALVVGAIFLAVTGNNPWEVYVKMAPGFETSTAEGTPQVMKLLKSLYGLRQSPRNWFGTIDNHLEEIGFKPLKSYCFKYYGKENS